MEDNNSVTHGLHWLTLTNMGWECAHPECGWYAYDLARQDIAQVVFDTEHANAKLSEAPASVQP